jgi:hypothetical protein
VMYGGDLSCLCARYVGDFAKCKSCMNCKKASCMLCVENLQS